MVNGPERLAAITAALDEIGIPFLVTGGHAVRYYGVDRNTIDYDLHLSLDEWGQLPDRLGEPISSPGLRSPRGRLTSLYRGGIAG